MKAVNYIFNVFFGKNSEYQIERDPEDNSRYRVLYQGMAIYVGSQTGCEQYVSNLG